MNQNTIQVTLIVKDDGTVVVQQFGKNTEEALAKTGKGAKSGSDALATLKSNWLEVTAATAAAGLAISKVMDYMDLAAKSAQAETSFRSLASASGEAADQIIANMKRASAGTIEDSQLMQKAAKAMLLEFSGDQIIKMTEMARLGARTTGEDVGQVFDKIVDAISTKMPRALKQYGLVTTEQMAIINQAMAEGVTEVNLYSTAWSNFAVQQAKIGPLMDDTAEKIQQARAEVQRMREEMGGEFNIAMSKAAESTNTFGKKATAAVFPLMTTWQILTSYVADATLRITAGIADLVGQTEKAKAIRDSLSGKTSGGPIGDTAAAEAIRKAYDEELKATLGAVARKKAELETMKALDKDYSKSREDNIKYISELMKAAGGDEFKITSDSLKKMEELNAEYCQRTSKEIELEAAARQKAERDKVSDLMYTAEKMKALDAESATRATMLEQQRTMLSFQTAKTDITNLTARLGDYQKYYDSLKTMMDKNTADEKKHVADLKATQQQIVDNQKTTADLIAKITGADKNISAQKQYESGRSGLNQQFMDITNQMAGPDRIKALQDYMQAVASLQAQFASIIPGAKVAEDATSDINRAEMLLQSSLVAIRDEQSKQITVDQLWGATIQGETAKNNTSMQDMVNTITDLTAKMKEIPKEIDIRGVDSASSIIASIAAELKQLHELAVIPITMKYAGGEGAMSIPANPLAEEMNLDSFAVGTPYIPRTGPYILHRGEAVVPASQNNGGKAGGIVINGGINLQIPAGAAPQRPEDWRAITRNYIVPELKKLSS
jgi:hypothetical protein